VGSSALAREALRLHIAGMSEDGDNIPEPSTLDELAGDPAMKGAVAFLVHIEPEIGRTVRINITARERQIEEIDRLAASSGMTRSAYMVHSALGVPKAMKSRRAAYSGKSGKP
jgi:HicB_like antitoxin of bacterial toxin-antitoxin system